MKSGKVINWEPIPEKIRKKIIITTGMCIAENQLSEYFIVFERQYPKGRFNIIIPLVAIQYNIVLSKSALIWISSPHF